MCCQGWEEIIKRVMGEGFRLSSGWEVVGGGVAVVCGVCYEDNFLEC